MPFETQQEAAAEAFTVQLCAIKNNHMPREKPANNYDSYEKVVQRTIVRELYAAYCLFCSWNLLLSAVTSNS